MDPVILAFLILLGWCIAGALIFGGWSWLMTAGQRRNAARRCPTCGSADCKYGYRDVTGRRGVGE